MYCAKQCSEHAPSSAQSMPGAMHATNATYATYGRIQDSSENRLVPDAPNPVDKRDFVRGDAVEVRMPHAWPRVGRVVSVLPDWVYVRLWSRSLGRFVHGQTAYHRDFLHHLPDEAVAS